MDMNQEQGGRSLASRFGINRKGTQGLPNKQKNSRRNLKLDRLDSECTTDERYALALEEQQAELDREEQIARQRINTEIIQEGEHKKMIFGRWPAKPVAVVWERADDPKEMMKGMEEYFFKQT